MNRKICIIIPALSDGGAQRQCIYLLNELQRRPGLDLHLIRFSDGVHDAELRRERVTTHDLPIKSNYDFRVLIGLLAVVRRIDPDIILSWLHAADVYSFFVRRLLPKTRWVMTERDSRYPNEFRYHLRHAVGKHADAIVANSEAGSEHWRRLGARGPRHVVGNILREVPVRSTRLVQQRRVICVGRLEPQKNVLALAKAAAILARRRPDVEFLFVGEGSLRGSIETIAAEAGVGDRVRLEGFQRDVDRYLLNASALASFSHHEGLPNALMEATAAGVQIVASDIPEHRALLGPGYPYYVRDTEASEAAATMLERAIDDPDAVSHLAHAQSLVRHMTPGAVADNYLAIFDHLLHEQV